MLMQSYGRRSIRQVRLVIESDDPAVLQLPWETLCHPEFGFLGRHVAFTLSRAIPSKGVWLPSVEKGPLRILLFTSLPDDLTENDQLQIEKEQARALEALGVSRQSGHVLLEMPDDGRFSTFRNLLKEFKPHLVWLSGHGVFRKNLLDGGGKGFFLFEGENGNGEEIDETQLAEAFSGTGVQAMVLSACQSGKAVSTNLNNGLMFTLSAKGVPHVIAMRESIFDPAGIQFAHAFFEALLKEKAIAIALQQARAAIRKPFEHEEKFKDSPFVELSFGQWCLPAMLSHEHDRALVDWDFTPQSTQDKRIRNKTFKDISLPTNFIGRRRVLRVLQRNFRKGLTKALMITGAGGMGKTALAGKLVTDLEQDDFAIFVFSARSDKKWKKSIERMEHALDEKNAKKYSAECQVGDTAGNAEYLLELLLMQYKGKVALLFDNLESVQDPTSRALTDPELMAWIDTACDLQAEGLRVVLTSRWVLPGWNFEHRLLVKPVYRDFLAFVQQMKLPQELLGDYNLLKHIYNVLGGNFRAVEFFVRAVKKMNSKEKEAFLQTLDGVQEEIQIDMALDKIWSFRSDAERELLRRMTAYTVPVAPEGVKAIALPDMPQATEVLDALLAVSLVERYHNPEWKCDEFLVSPLVRSWLEKQGVEKPDLDLLQKAAGYHKWLLGHERQTLEQAMIVHAALMAAGQNDEAHRIALKLIVGPMNMAGLYRSSLDSYLLPARTSSDLWILSEALGQTGKQHMHLAEYETAMEFYQRSLTIRQEIGDKSGEGRTLNNISQVYDARGDYETALEYLKRSLTNMQEIGDKFGEGATLNNIAGIYHARGDYETAMEFYQRSLTIRQQIGDKSGEGTTLNNISQVYDARGDYETAMEFYQRSLTIMQEIGDKFGEGTTLNNISQIFKARGDYDTALEYLNRSLTIQHEIGDRAGLCVTLFNMGLIYLQKEDFQNAKSAWVTSYRIAKAIGYTEALKNLESLAGQIGLPGGLDGWEQLSQQMGENEGGSES